MANYAAHLTNHNLDNHTRLTSLIDSLPEGKKPVLKAIVQEGYAASRTGVQIALDVADTAARSTATAVVMRRESWLQTSGILRDLQTKMVDLPFNSQKLFAESTDSVLHSSKDSRATLRTLGIYTPHTERKSTTLNKDGTSTSNSVPSTTGVTSKGDINSTSSTELPGDVPNRAVRPRGRAKGHKFDTQIQGCAITTIAQGHPKRLFHHRLRPFYDQWQRIPTDKWVLEIIATGYAIPFQSLPPPRPPPRPHLQEASHVARLKQEVDHLMLIGAVERVPEQPQGRGFYSRYFLTEKKTGGWRPILDL
ncbi:uncharacterized protein LOC142012530 isoform X2 [Carettochelys insculpta]|uniref:uncharacterized protein LOC142012530 isoform X2 n=1 Tax=Carettochelys insculpta TaxID=44489 RepID=UPI003EBF9960